MAVSAYRKMELREHQPAHVNRGLLSLRNINQIMVRETNPQKLLQETCNFLIETSGYHLTWIILMQNGKVKEPFFHSGFSGAFSSMETQFRSGAVPTCAGEAMDRHSTVVRKDPQSECGDCLLKGSHQSEGCASNEEAIMTAALEHKGEVYGWISVVIPIMYVSNPDEVQLFAEIAQNISYALHNIELKLEQEESLIYHEIQEEKFKKALIEKDYLIKEINHRVKNNLTMISSLINLKASSFDEQFDISDIGRQIDAIRIIHEKLNTSKDITHIDASDYFEDLLVTVFSSILDIPVTIENNIENLVLPTNIAVPLGLIINEIATNAGKHGFTYGSDPVFKIELSANEVQNRYSLLVSNNGNPFPEEIDIIKPATLGLQIISALVKQLKGIIELKRAPYPEYHITFPINQVE